MDRRTNPCSGGRADDDADTGAHASACDDAYHRISARLAALGVQREYTRHELIGRVMARTMAQLDGNPHNAAGSPANYVEAAMNELEQETEAWLIQVLDLDNLESQEAALQGRMALILADLPSRWPDLFLADPPWPEEFVEEMRTSLLEVVPGFVPGRMEARPLDLGKIPQFADVALRTLDESRWLRLVFIWGAAVALFLFVFYYTR